MSVKPRRESTEVARGAAFNAGSNLVFYALSLAFYLVIVRLLPADALGVYYSLGVVVTFSTTFAFFNLPGGFLRFLTGLVQTGRLGEAAYMFRRSLAIGTTLAGLSTLVLLVLTPSISQWLFGSMEYLSLIYLAIADFVIVGLNNFLNEPLYAARAFGRLGLLSVVYSALRYGFAILLLLLGYGIAALVYGWIAADLFYFISYFYFAVPLLNQVRLKTELKGIFAYSLPLLLSSGVVLVLQNVDRLFVLKYLGIGELGIYGSILIATQVPQILPGAVGTSLPPALIKLEESGGLPAEAVTRSIRYISVVSIPILGLVAALGRPLVDLFLGTTFTFAWVSFAILTLGYAAMCPDIPLGLVLSTKKRTRILGLQQIVSSACLALFAVLLIPTFFLSGAALAYVLARVAGFAFILPFLYRLGYFKVEWKEYLKIIGTTLVTIGVTIFVEARSGYATSLLPFYFVAGVAAMFVSFKGFNVLRSDDYAVVMDVIPASLRPIGSGIWRALRFPTGEVGTGE